jgi:hypothetical protein
MRKKKEIKFNPADYAYLDKATVEDYIIEFLLRDSNVMEDLKVFIDASKNDSADKKEKRLEIHEKYKIAYTRNCEPARNEAELKEYLKTKKMRLYIKSAVIAYRIFPEDNEENRLKEKKLLERMMKYHEQDDWASACCCNSHLGKWDAEDDTEGILECLLGETSHGYYDIGDTLLIAINLNKSKREIEKEIEKVLRIHKQRKKSSVRIDKWKYYLIVYDLKQPNINYSEIADLLSHAYPTKKHLFDERNIENYYKTALELVNGGYKRYIRYL